MRCALEAPLRSYAQRAPRTMLARIAQHGAQKLGNTGACSVAVSYEPPMLVTRVQLPACACFFVRRGRILQRLAACDDWLHVAQYG